MALGEDFDPENYLITTFYLESAEEDFEKTAEAIAVESSIGTWTDIGTMTADIFHRLAAKVFYIEKMTATSGIVKIAYPIALFELDNMPQLLADVAGNVFGLREIKNLRVRDIDIPEKFVKSNKGPFFGIGGIRERLKIYDRPLLGTIIKPKIGLSPKEHAKVAFEAWVGGVDIVKDDENLSDQDFNPFYERFNQTQEALLEAERVTGEKKMYCPNVSARLGEMYARARWVRDNGGKAIMVDIMTVGFSSLQYMRDQGFELIIHGHRAMHGAFTHGDKHGISMLTISKIARLAGVDQLHTGTVIGKMEGTEEEVLKIDNFLKQEWFGIKPVMPIASGGLHPGLLPEIVKILGTDLIINCGGGIHGHPEGTRKGAQAARQSLEAFIKGKTLSEYAKDHEELKLALEKWGEYGKEINTIPEYRHVLVPVLKKDLAIKNR